MAASSSLWLLAGLAGVGCGGAAGELGVGKQAPAAANACARRTSVAVRPMDARGVGSTVALARVGDRTVAYVADEDARAVRAVDVDSDPPRELSSTPVGGTPSQLLIAKDGRLVVALRDESRLRVLEPSADAAARLGELCAVPTAVEPVALATTPDERTLLVTSGWGAALTAMAIDDLAVRWRVGLAREPRGVVVSDDGKKAFVAHVVGSRMSVVDLVAAEHTVGKIDLRGTEKGSFRRRGVLGSLVGGEGDPVERSACQGFALAKTVEPKGRILAPQVLVDPGDLDETSGGYGSGGMVPVEVADVAVVDDVTGEPLPASLTVAPDFRGGRAQPACLLPRAAAVDPQAGTLLVTCLGVDMVVELDAAAADPHAAELRRWSVAAGPTGIAVDASARRAVVWSQFDHTISIVPLVGPALVAPASRPVKSAVLPARSDGPEAAKLALGRKLFHTSDPKIASDGRACASCHPDGRDDSLTWSTPDGPRQTPMLAGRIEATAPYGWSGSNKDVHEHLTHTFQRLGGSGLSPAELDALVAFATRVAAPGGAPGTPADPLVARGGEIFHSAQAGCASCHVGEKSTDRAAHDVGSRAKADAAPGFETPSLRFVGGTAPYFHDGRYATLRARLVDTSGEMGHTKQLSSADLAALEAYLRTL